MTRGMPKATAALQDLRFCCRNSWRGNRCRKRWLSSYEKGISSPCTFYSVTHLSGMDTIHLKPYGHLTSHFLFFSTVIRVLCIAVLHKTEKHTWKESGCITAVMSSNETLYFLLRIKIEEEYAKNLSKLSQIHLAGQEEGWATFVLKVSSSKTVCCWVVGIAAAIDVLPHSASRGQQ